MMNPAGSPTARMSVEGQRRQQVLDVKSVPPHLPIAAHATSTRRVGRTCREAGCTKNPYFGHPGEKAMFCKAHKEEGMIDVKNKQCERLSCMKRGLFGYEGQKARFCGTHRMTGMIDLKNKRCKSVGCSKQATYAAVGDSTGFYCSAHRSPEMVDVKGRRCEDMSCIRRATYGFQNEKPRCCVRHRQLNMVPLRQRARAPKGRNTPGTPSSEATDEDASGVFDDLRSSEGVSDGSKSFAERFSKFGRKYQMGTSARAGVDGEAVDWGVGSTGVTSALQNTPGSHLDLLLPPQHRAASPLSTAGEGWYSASGALSTLSGPRHAGLRASRGASRPQPLGGSVGPGTVPGDSWHTPNNPLPRLNPSSAWMAHSMDGHAGIGAGGSSAPSAHQWNAYEGSLSSSVAEESVSCSAGPEDLSTSYAPPPIMVRSCSALPIAALGGASGRGIGKLAGGVHGEGFSRGSGVQRPAGVLTGTSGTIGAMGASGVIAATAGDGWRPSTPEPRTLSAPQPSVSTLSGGTAQETLLFSPVTGRMGDDLVGTVISSPGDREGDTGAASGANADAEYYEHWMRTLVECSKKGTDPDEETLSEGPAEESVSSVASSDKYASMPVGNPQVNHEDPLHQQLAGHNEFGSGELGSFTKPALASPFLNQQQPMRLVSGSGKVLSGLTSPSDGVGVSAPASFEMSPYLHVSNGSTASCTSSGSSTVAVTIRSPSTDSPEASPPYETPSDLDMTFVRMNQGLRSGDGGAVMGTAGDATAARVGGAATSSIGGNGGNAPCGGSVEGASLNYLLMNFADGYTGGLH